jgi:hypothetical protein
MKVPFNNLGPESRIWIYQADRKLKPEEQQFIIRNTEAFLEEWTAHGHDLEAGVQIAYDQFLIIGVNEAVNEASGCSIDKSVSFVRELDKSLNADLLERSRVALLQDAEIHLIDFSEIRKLISEGLITPSSQVFNNAIVTKEELEKNWLKPASDSWIKRFFQAS